MGSEYGSVFPKRLDLYPDQVNLRPDPKPSSFPYISYKLEDLYVTPKNGAYTIITHEKYCFSIDKFDA